jgi:hypothetical protein
MRTIAPCSQHGLLRGLECVFCNGCHLQMTSSLLEVPGGECFKQMGEADIDIQPEGAMAVPSERALIS